MLLETGNAPNRAENPLYLDRFDLAPSAPFESIEDFTTRFICEQPRWLTTLSMGVGKLEKRRAATAEALAGGATDLAIGNWRLIDRTPTTLVLGEDMRPLQYELTFTLDSPTQLTATTEVLRQSAFGKLYWLIVQRIHLSLFQRMLRNAGGPHSTTTGGKVR